MTQAPQQKAIKEDERSILLARQGYLLNNQRQGRLRDQADRTLRILLSEPYFAVSPFPSTFFAVAFGPNGRQMAAFAGDDRVYLWDLSRPGKQPDILTPPRNVGVWSLAFSPDGKSLVAGLGTAGSSQGGLLIWNLEQPDALPVFLEEHEGKVFSLAFSPNGKFLTAGGNRDLTLWRWDPNGSAISPIHLRIGSSTEIMEGSDVRRAVAFSPDGKILATGETNGVVSLWNPLDPVTPVAILHAHEGPVESLAFNSDGKTLASGGQDNLVKLWNLKNPNTPSAVLHGHQQSIISLAFSPGWSHFWPQAAEIRESDYGLLIDLSYFSLLYWIRKGGMCLV